MSTYHNPRHAKLVAKAWTELLDSGHDDIIGCDFQQQDGSRIYRGPITDISAGIQMLVITTGWTAITSVSPRGVQLCGWRWPVQPCRSFSFAWQLPDLTPPERQADQRITFRCPFGGVIIYSKDAPKLSRDQVIGQAD